MSPIIMRIRSFLKKFHPYSKFDNIFCSIYKIPPRADFRRLCSNQHFLARVHWPPLHIRFITLAPALSQYQSPSKIAIAGRGTLCCNIKGGKINREFGHLKSGVAPPRKKIIKIIIKYIFLGVLTLGTPRFAPRDSLGTCFPLNK